MIRVLLVDDQPLIREGLRTILDAQPDLEVVGEAGDGDEALRASHRLRPDLVLMDVEMPRGDGLAATERIVAAGGPRVVILTTFDREDYIARALRAGASGFLLKTASPADLAGAVRTAMQADALLAPEVTRRLIESYLARPDPASASWVADLTDREREVLVLIATGLSNDQIAEHLFLSPATVKTHVNRVFAKSGVRDRAQAVIAAYEAGLVTPGADGASR
ncbi:MAG TPA: response regulator transcription factor [Thermoleophilaceae bacterium]